MLQDSNLLYLGMVVLILRGGEKEMQAARHRSTEERNVDPGIDGEQKDSSGHCTKSSEGRGLEEKNIENEGAEGE